MDIKWRNCVILKYVYFKILPFRVQSYISKIVFRPKFGKGVIIGKGPKFYNGDVSFGDGTRIAGTSVFWNVEVGNCTVLGQNFRMLGFIHDYTAFSVNNMLADKVRKVIHTDFTELHEPNISNYPKTVIGDNVRIGCSVTVRGGVKIGDGAVIKDGSIVTHDVPAFAVVAGVPARFIKWCFDEEIE